MVKKKKIKVGPKECIHLHIQYNFSLLEKASKLKAGSHSYIIKFTRKSILQFPYPLPEGEGQA